MKAPPRSIGNIQQRAERSFVERELILPAQSFIHTETIGAGVLLLAAIAALVWANSPWSESYHLLWEKTYLGFDLGFLEIRESLRHWVNDGLMVIFFFVVGLEVKHELVHGELSSLKRASLPLIAALGGMVVPAGIYLALNQGSAGARGWGIPMATDIAFALGALALAGKGLPFQARVFLLALATVDDIGAILLIAGFYSTDISVPALLIAAVLVGVLFLLRAIGVRDVKFYLFGGFAVWLAVFESGVHATIAGVVLGLLTPSRPFFEMERFQEAIERLIPRFRKALSEQQTEEADVVLGRLEALTIETEAPLDRRMRLTHPWSAFVVLPLFAFANSGVEISAETMSAATTSSVTLGVIGGLLFGKLIGILGFSFLAVKLGVADLPKNLKWSQVGGLALIAGIGFTVSLFITELAFVDVQLVAQAKTGILVASAAAGIMGVFLMRAVGGSRQET